MPERNTSNDYDSEPVVYCAKCYSLNIKHEDSIDTDCCMDCGCSDMKEADIEYWEKLYKERYGRRFAVKSTDLRNHPVFKMSVYELRQRFCQLPVWRQLARMLYPDFPVYFSRTDSAFMLFDKLLKDGRIDDFRKLLIRYYKKEICQPDQKKQSTNKHSNN